MDFVNFTTKGLDLLSVCFWFNRCGIWRTTWGSCPTTALPLDCRQRVLKITITAAGRPQGCLSSKSPGEGGTFAITLCQVSPKHQSSKSLCVWVCVCMDGGLFLCTCECLHACGCWCVFVGMCGWVSMCVHVAVCGCVYLFLCVSVYACVWMCVCVCLCVCVCICFYV